MTKCPECESDLELDGYELDVGETLHCPECESDLELDGYDVDVGETMNCPECSVELKVVANDPVGVALVAEEEE